MALMSSYALGSEVGLRLLLSPAASHVIVRTACTVAGIGFPVYSTHKAIVSKNQADQDQWLVYWAAYGCFSVAEVFSDKILSWCPFYYHAKFAFLVWLQLPRNSGARQLYNNLLRPVLLKHHARLDRIVDGTRNELSKFISNHEQEFKFIKRMIKKFSVLVYQAAQDALQFTRAMEGGPNAPSGGGSSVSSSPPAADNSVELDETAEDSGWIYTDRPGPSD